MASYREDNLDSALDRYSEAAKTTRSVRSGTRPRDWAAYTAAAGSALVGGTVAEASIIYSGVQNVMVTRAATSGFTSAVLNLNNDGLDDLVISLNYNSTFAAAHMNGVFATTGFQNPGLFLTSGNYAVRLASSNNVSSLAGSFDNEGPLRVGVISTTSSVVTSGFWPGGPPNIGSSGFVGVAIFDGNDYHYGWLRLSIQNDALGLPFKVTAVDWAYESDPNTAIHVGSVPEPSSLALLAGGAAGVTAFRRRRRSA